MNYLKKIIIASSLIIIGSQLTGCKVESMKSPEKLLEKPITDEVYNSLYKDIRNITPVDTNFILPQNAEEVGKINLIDLNNNGSEEAIIFKKKENENTSLSSIYVYIFETTGKNIKEETQKVIRVSGDSIKYANFIDVNNDGNKEILLQVRNREYEYIYIYKYDTSGMKKIGEYSDSKNSIKLNAFDYNDDEHVEILALIQDLNIFEVSISELIVENNAISFKEHDKSQNVDNVDKIEIINGRVSKNKKGSIVIYPNLSGSSNSQIVIYEDNKFIKTLSDKEENLKNPFTLRPQDINKNGILDLPKMEFKYSNNTPNETKVISWYEWDGNIKDSTLILSNQIFYSFDYNFKIVMPEELNYNFFIRQKFEEKKSTFEFFKRDDKLNLHKIFEIKVFIKNDEEFEKDTTPKSESDILFENEDFQYVITDINDKELNLMNISFEDIKKSFHQINK